MSTMTITLIDEETEEETEHELPCKMEVCYDCEGHGFVLNASMRYHAYTQEEFSDFDDEEREHYFRRGGMYDVQCPTCKGKNVMPVVNEEACKNSPKLKEILEKWQAQEEERAQSDADYEAECRMERMMGC